MISDIRFRAEGNLVVLQVCNLIDKPYHSYERDTVWRDAKVEDLLEAAKFCRTDVDSRLDHIGQRMNELNYSLNSFLMATQKPEVTHE